MQTEATGENADRTYQTAVANQVIHQLFPKGSKSPTELSEQSFFLQYLLLNQ